MLYCFKLDNSTIWLLINWFCKIKLLIKCEPQDNWFNWTWCLYACIVISYRFIWKFPSLCSGKSFTEAFYQWCSLYLSSLRLAEVFQALHGVLFEIGYIKKYIYYSVYIQDYIYYYTWKEIKHKYHTQNSSSYLKPIFLLFINWSRYIHNIIVGNLPILSKLSHKLTDFILRFC